MNECIDDIIHEFNVKHELKLYIMHVNHVHVYIYIQKVIEDTFIFFKMSVGWNVVM